MNGCERRYSLLGGFIGGALLFGLLVHRFMQPPKPLACKECGVSGDGVVEPAAGLCHVCLNRPPTGPHYRSPDEEARVRYMTNRRNQP